ncbi:MAG: division/cell wall cluster transcriptional repressor MraZ [Syntrophorhabdales bacterium]|jgi:MraZ protein
MLSGRYEYAIDDKGRLSIPAKFRDILASRCEPQKRRIEDHYITERASAKKTAGPPVELKLILTNLDGCIVAYPESEWEELQGRIARSAIARKEAKNFLRFFYSGASDCPIDRLGRILIPQYLRNYAAIKKNVVIVGMTTKIEIWAEEAWSEVMNRVTSDPDQMADIASELDL